MVKFFIILSLVNGILQPLVGFSGSGGANSLLQHKHKDLFLFISKRKNSSIGDTRSGYLVLLVYLHDIYIILNEDAAPAVRKDFEMYFNKIVPENDPEYLHDDEGSDDMPAHLKAALLGSSVIIPVIDGKLALGTWQGIYLCEHRNHIPGGIL